MNWSVHINKKYRLGIKTLVYNYNNKKYRLGIKRLVDHYDNRVEIIQLENERGDIKDDPNVSFDSFDHMRWHIVTY